jgi:hypothetical protein
MKLTQGQLRKLIMELVYFPPEVKPEDIKYANQIRRDLSSVERKKADALAKQDPMMGISIGGFPEDRNDIETIGMPIEDTTVEGYADDLSMTDVPNYIEEILEGADDEITVDEFYKILKDEYEVDAQFLKDAVTPLGLKPKWSTVITTKMHEKLLKDYIRYFIDKELVNSEWNLYNDIIYKEQNYYDEY